jgi:hypothetical protein
MGRQQASGLSVAAWCSREGVSKPLFYVWRRRFHTEKVTGDRTPVSSLVPVQIVGDQPADVGGRIEVQWPDGVVLRAVGRCDPKLLGAMVTVLSSKMPRRRNRC